MKFKKSILLFAFTILLSSFYLLNAQNVKSTNFNGWEFLTWHTSIEKVEAKLSKMKRLTVNYYKDNGYSTYFKYNDMFTYLFYDSLKQLSKVTQHLDFGVNKIKQADAFFLKTEKHLIDKFGLPSERFDDKESEFILLVWKLKYTTINLSYNYKYKVIDEFGCCSYTVNIVYTPNI